jgi:hypothetical protein
MIAYNKDQLYNLHIHEQLDEAYNEHYISREERENCKKKYAVIFYMPNIFIRSGLFLLTLVISLFSFGLIILLFINGNDESIITVLVLFGLLAYSILEFVVIKKNHFKSGVDDALLWISLICLVSAFLISDNDSSLTVSIVVFILSCYLSMRFADRVMSGIACLSFLAVCFFGYNKLGDFAETTASFLLMIIAALTYIQASSRELLTRYKYHRDCFIVAQVTALICFYLAGNYYIVRETGNAMFHLNLQEGQAIPFAWFFWIWTVFIPLFYLVRGIQKRNLILLRVGLLLIAGLIFTVRYYHHFIDIEIAMITGGILMTTCAYILIKYLSKPKHGFISKETITSKNIGLSQVESLLIAQTFGQSHPGTSDDTEFGGGSGGGGGAGGEF